MVSTDDAADAALADVLGPGDAATQEAPGSLDDVDLPDLDASGPSTAIITSTGDAVAGLDEDEPATCTADEARGMVDEMRVALDQLDRSLSRIMETRAWKALGYSSPAQFVMAELGPDPEDKDNGRVSKRHAYRLARLAMFLYGLAERLGAQDNYPFELSERMLRSIPTGPGGVNDQVLLDRVQQRVDEMTDPTEDDVQAILDDEITRARSEIQQEGKLSDDPDDSPTGGSGEGMADDPLAGMNMGDLGEFEDDTHPEPSGNPSNRTGGDHSDSADEATEWEGAGQGSLSRDGVASSYGNDTATEESMTAAATLREMLTMFARLPDMQEHLPGVLEYASVTELDDLIAQTTAAEQVIADIRRHSEEMA